VRLYFQSPRVRKWWRSRREYGYDPGFQSIIDKIAEEFEAAGQAAPPSQETKN
jgi:hypothetical protein